MADQQVVVFNLHTEEYGIDIHAVHEIVPVQDITTIPLAEGFLEGIINLRGRIIPIIDLKERFYGIKTVKTDNTRIIVVDVGNQVIGIITDEVSEVMVLEKEMIEAAPPMISRSSDCSGIWGIGKLENRLLILLDLAKAFSPVEKKQILEAVS